MSDTHPGVEDEVEHALRLGLATAAQLADRFARARQEIARDAQRRSDDEHRQLEARFRAEGASAAARLSVVERPEWWNHASPEQVVSIYELAQQWRDDQSYAANAASTIALQVEGRYGVDVTTPDAESHELRAALARVEIDRPTVNNPAADETVSRDQGAAADHPERRAVQNPAESGSAYDTLERRDATAAQMRGTGLSAQIIAVAMRADIAHAHPTGEAGITLRSDLHATNGVEPGSRTHQTDRSR